MVEELNAMERNKVWRKADLPPGKKLVETKWIFKTKRSQYGVIDRYKARIVARGFTQKPGEDYSETFAPVSRYESLRILLAISASQHLQLRQIDVKSAFLTAPLEEEIYIRQPSLYDDHSGQVLRLERALYGLKQAGRNFNIKLNQVLIEAGLNQSKLDNCFYYRKEGPNLTLTLCYVDDLIIASSDEETIERLKSAIQKHFEITSGELKHFLGIDIRIDNEFNISMNQSKYIRELLDKFQLAECKPVSIPIEGSLYENTGPPANYQYRQLLGALLYISVSTRPDICFAVSFLSRFLSNHTKSHWTRAVKVLRYLKGTENYGIVFSGAKGNLQDTLFGYSDSDYANDPTTRKSVSGCLFVLNSGPIIWTSSQQRSVSLSTTESELIAACLCAQSGLWLKYLFNELGFEITPKIKIDSQSALALIHNPVYHKRSKHIEVKYLFIREKCADKELLFEYVPTERQLSDILTKPLTRYRFTFLRSLLSIREVN